MTQNTISFAFWGTPDVAVETLDILKVHGYIPSVIVTSPDRPQGRGLVITPPPAKVWAIDNNIPYLQPEKINEEFALQLTNYNLSLSIVVAYGKIMPEKLIQLPQKGTINIHYSLLPKYRGASPVESAILNGDTETGVAIQQMAYGLDTGDILVDEKIKILPQETAPQLRKRLISIGGELLAKSLPLILEGSINPRTQDNTNATHCGKIKKEDGLIVLSDDPEKNWNKYRAYFGWPGIFFFDAQKKRIKITQAHFENGKFIIEKVIPEGKKEQHYTQFLKN